MRRATPILCLLLALLAMPACANQAGDAAGEAAAPESEDDKTIYAMGLAMAQNLQNFDLTEEELEMLQAGLEAGIRGDEPTVDLQEYGPKIQTFAQQRMMAAAAREREEGTRILDEMAAEEGAQRTESGLVYISMEEGDGESPAATDQVQVHYKGTLRDGTTFDSSYDRGQPVTFPLNQVVPCWTEGVQMMKEGGKAKLVCPPDLAYGDQPPPGSTIPAGATLVFEVELLDVVGDAATPTAEGAMGEMMDEPATEDAEGDTSGEG